MIIIQAIMSCWSNCLTEIWLDNEVVKMFALRSDCILSVLFKRCHIRAFQFLLLQKLVRKYNVMTFYCSCLSFLILSFEVNCSTSLISFTFAVLLISLNFFVVKKITAAHIAEQPRCTVGATKCVYVWFWNSIYDISIYRWNTKTKTKKRIYQFKCNE